MNEREKDALFNEIKNQDKTIDRLNKENILLKGKASKEVNSNIKQMLDTFLEDNEKHDREFNNKVQCEFDKQFKETHDQFLFNLANRKRY